MQNGPKNQKQRPSAYAPRSGKRPQNAKMRTKTGYQPYQSNAVRMRRKKSSAVSGLASALVIMIFVSAGLLVTQNVNWEKLFADRTRSVFSNEDQNPYGPMLTAAERDAYLTKYETVGREDIYRGSCILVNHATLYHAPEEPPVVSIYKNKSKSYKVNSGKMKLQQDAVMAMNRMMDDFYAETGSRDVMINSAYRSAKEQQQIFDRYTREKGAEYAENYVQKPGYSEHETGYAVDLAVYEEYEDGTSAMWTFDGKDKYFWIDKHCEQYGYILRYSASKEDVTHIKYESWHYRYVGIGNALVMNNMALALEEYILFIKDYSYDTTRFYVTADNGDQYAVYYVPSDGTDDQQIPIPKIAQSYSISGNNIDGFIVTALVGKESSGK